MEGRHVLRLECERTKKTHRVLQKEIFTAKLCRWGQHGIGFILNAEWVLWALCPSLELLQDAVKSLGSENLDVHGGNA